MGQFIDAMEAMTVIDLGWLDRDGDDWDHRIRSALVDFEVTRLRRARLGADFCWGAEQEAIGMADVFGELGMLSGEEVESWRERVISELRSAAEAPAPLAGEETRERANKHLSGLLSAVSEGAAPEGGGHSRQQLLFMRALEALHKVGALSSEEAEGWRERLAERVGEESPREQREQAIASNCSAVELERVFAGPAETQDGLRVTTVELYTDGIVVRWHLPLELTEEEQALPRRERRFRLTAARREAHPDFELYDDVGTQYQRVRGGFPPGIAIDHHDDRAEVLNWQSVFSPAAPREATRLELADGARRRFTLHVPRAGGADD